MSDSISLCVDCKHYSGKPKYVAKRNNGIKCVSSNSMYRCLKYNTELWVMQKNEETVPDVAECESYEKG